MKVIRRTHFGWIPLAMAVVLMGKLAVSAQDWQTVDDFALAGGDAEARGVAVDGAGGVYVVGTANGHGIVRYSADGGANWSTRDDSATNNVVDAITINNQGDLFVGGASGGHWIVRRSTDHGMTWETVDDYFRPMIDPSHPGTNGVVFSLASDSQGRIYGVGNMHVTGPTYNRWWVRGSGLGGTNWDTKLVLFSDYGTVAQMTCAGEDVYVTGAEHGDPSEGAILRSGDLGATWSKVFESTNEVDRAIAADSAGNVYAGGSISISNSPNWLMRKATPGSTNWTILDQFSSSGTPNSIKVDAAGNICVAGYSADTYSYISNGWTVYYSIWKWRTRQYSAASGQWATTDVFSYSTNPTNLQTAATGTAIAPDGSTFVVGYGTSDSNQRHWLVRKQGTLSQPRLQIVLANRSVEVSWPVAYTNSTLEWTDSAGGNPLWQTFTGAVCVTNGQNTATLNLAPGTRFFRLKSTPVK